MITIPVVDLAVHIYDFLLIPKERNEREEYMPL